MVAKLNTRNRTDVLVAFELMEGREQAERMIAKYDDRESVIYGAGGWHRYFPKYDKAIIYFSKYHCRGDSNEVGHCRNAADLGFIVTDN